MSFHLSPTINGIKQHIWIRGANAANPAILFLHGGPGSPLMLFHKQYFSALENVATVVHWDQRGTCKSFSPSIPTQSMHIQQFVDDTLAVTELVLKHLNKTSLVLWATSWGSIIGTMAVMQRPSLFTTYIGVGQNVDMMRAEVLSYNFVVEQAKKYNNTKALQELHTITLPYQQVKEVMVQRHWLMEFGGFFKNTQAINWLFTYNFLRSFDVYSPLDVIRFFRGQLFSINALWREIMTINFQKTIRAFPVPFYFLEGRYDYQCPSELAEAFYSSVKAPEKHLIWFESSAHMPYIEENEKFLTVMRQIISTVK